MKKLLPLILLTSLVALPVSGLADNDAEELLTQVENLTGKSRDWLIQALTDAELQWDQVNRIREKECETPRGRIKWHGEIVENTIDKDALTQTQVHADGYVYVRHFKSLEAIPLELQLSKEELIKRREEERLARIAEIERQRNARIEELQTNMHELATNLARVRDYPYELAEMLLTNELNKLLKIQTVNAVITPQEND